MQNQTDIVIALGPYDVLFGRGSGPNDHEGNIRFRQLVAERKAEYMATNHRLTKAKIAREIVDQVFNNNGRFLKKVEADDPRMVGLTEGTEAWTGVDDDTIMEKAKQALRQNTNKNKDRGKSPPRVTGTVVSGGNPTNPYSMPASTMVQPNMGFGLEDDLEPIPIPSSQYPNSAGRLVADSARHDDMHAWGMGGTSNNGVKQQPQPSQQQPRGIQPHPYQQQQHHQQQQQQSHMPQSPSHPSSMQPPAARTPSMRTSISSIDKQMDRDQQTSVMEIGDLMDSFSKTSLGETRDTSRYMGSSVETMGTIEPMSMVSEANMSYATVNSSMFSVLRSEDDGTPGTDKGSPQDAAVGGLRRTEDHSFGQLDQEELPSYIQAFKNTNSASTFGLASDASMSITDLTAMRNAGNKRQTSSTVLENVKEEGYQQAYDSILEVDPTGSYGDSVDDGGIEAMGSSSLNLLKGMLMSQESIPPGAPTSGGDHRTTDQPK